MKEKRTRELVGKVVSDKTDKTIPVICMTMFSEIPETIKT